MPGENQSIAQGGVQKMVGNWDDWDIELFEAARYGDLIKVQTALENGANQTLKIMPVKRHCI